jgi:heme/copper-type cytochrome/quinol oxidase subunit 2
VVESSSSTAPLFTYAAVIDNATADSSFVAGDEDVPPPAGPVATATPPPAATATPTPPPPAATPTPTPTPTPESSTTVVQLLAVQFEWIFDGGGPTFVARVGQTYELHMSSDDVQHGFGGIPELGLGGVTLNPGAAPTIRSFTPTSAQVGSHPFTCSITCGKGHPFDGTIEVVP